ncbi:hypothetical protein V6Z11_A01G110500 [Gossypium hirsutum]
MFVDIRGLMPVNKNQTLSLASLVPVCDSGLCLAGFIPVIYFQAYTYKISS